MPSIAMSNGERRGARQRGADGLRDPAPVRVAAVERGLDQRRVGDRARDALDALAVAAAHDDAADAAGALAVADDVERELAQQRVERLAEAQLVLALGRDARRRWRPSRCRIDGVVGRQLPVDRDAVERALDASRRAAGRRSRR